MVAGALGRPEVWPFLGLAGLWLWRYDPDLPALAVRLVSCCWCSLVRDPRRCPSKSFLTAGNIAENSPRAIHGNKITGTIDRFHELLPNTVWLAAVLAVAWAAWRRRIAILVLAAGAVLWVLIEIAFALHGFPAVPRYMFEAGGDRRDPGRRFHRPDRPRVAGAPARAGRGDWTAAGLARAWPRTWARGAPSWCSS